ncbi:hypothetical protein [Microbacterium tumbae]
MTVVAIVLGVMGFRRRRVKPHWTTPAWKMVRVKVRTTVVPVLRVDWGVRGHADIHDVLCTVSGPQGNTRDLTWPNGTVQMGKDFFTYVSLIDGAPFNTLISSPVDIGKPVTSMLDRAVTGRYTLRVRWSEEIRPSKLRERTFSHTVE